MYLEEQNEIMSFLWNKVCKEIYEAVLMFDSEPVTIHNLKTNNFSEDYF